MGDFNEIANSFEKKGGHLRLESQMQSFRMALEECSLDDLGFNGRWFTWERGRFVTSNIRERLDRVVATLRWTELFPYYRVEHLSHSFSDHCPVLLNTMGGRREDHNHKLVQQWWNDAMGSIPNKLELLSHQMLHWSKVKGKEERRGRVALEERLSYLFNQDISDENLAEISEIQLGLNLEADKEELLWKQRARVNWLKHGDRNTTFFHKTACQRQFRGRMTELQNENSERYTSSKEILKLASDYFEKLFTALDISSDEHLFGLVNKRVSDCMNEYLLKQFTEDDITNAVNVSRYCLDILNGQLEVGEINRTRIVLIPKIEKLKNMTHFLPIILVLRMSALLSDCINKAQGAFIPGRLISDNVLIAYEVLHSLKMKKKGKKGNFALKLDMSKTYDRVEWDFLAGMMKHLGFHDDWIVLIMRCVCSISYSVCLNGMHGDWFSPSRGLRQGDPLSPYLFLICAEGFSTLLQKAKQKGDMTGAPIGREHFSINHLFFADDCILFGDASNEGARVVRDVIHEYETVSGQRVNYDKSIIYFGANVNVNVKEDITSLLGVRVALSPEKYLGLPMMVRRRKTWAFANFGR
ncbi:reverse transcriptase [Gossypium australe]|uniref:Reverse transcriptase n=1 Tax=Gossypium australe TaxID=47621 RepID=A0A5B6W9K1_9ROSI|nr:reverse transcriptase [Gossypium australe]